MKKIILIPAYEPDEKLIQLVNHIDKNEFDIIVINDGSGDKYNKIFDKVSKQAKVISYSVNQGKGHALKTGFSYIKEKYSHKYIIVTMDSDGQHTISDAIKLCNYIEKSPNSLALGKRLRGKNTPLRSKIGNEITRIFYGITTGLFVYDTQTGLRAFSNQLIDFFLSIDGERFEYEMNVLLLSAKEKIHIEEIEIETIYIENNSSSHFDTLKDSFRIYKEIVKFSLSSILSFFIDYILFTVFVVIFHNIILSNVIARIISATVNYNMNRLFVFQSNNKIHQSAITYSLLAILILILNTIILNIFVYKMFINHFAAKILTEIILFILSWIIQKTFVFRRIDK